LRADQLDGSTKAPENDRSPGGGCQPIVRAFTECGFSEFWQGAATFAATAACAKRWETFSSTNVAKARDAVGRIRPLEMMDASEELASREGLFVAPEGGACIAGLKKLRQSGS